MSLDKAYRPVTKGKIIDGFSLEKGKKKTAQQKILQQQFIPFFK